jgi:hypothetical protein
VVNAVSGGESGFRSGMTGIHVHVSTVLATWLLRTVHVT